MFRTAGKFFVLWHLGRDVEAVEPIDDGTGTKGELGWRLRTRRNREFALEVRVEGASCRAELVRGQQSPMLGWSSPTYNVLVPIWVVVLEVDVANDAYLSTRVTPVDGR